jgi:hypothetical protein
MLTALGDEFTVIPVSVASYLMQSSKAFLNSSLPMPILWGYLF